MAAKRTVRRTTRPAVRDVRGRLAQTWDETREALDMGRATLEKRARALMKTRGLDPDRAAERLAALRRRLGQQGRKAVKQVEGRLVRRTLLALDLPSRQEFHELTLRVEDLSRKIDGLRGTARRRPTKTSARRR